MLDSNTKWNFLIGEYISVPESGGHPGDTEVNTKALHPGPHPSPLSSPYLCILYDKTLIMCLVFFRLILVYYQT